MDASTQPTLQELSRFAANQKQKLYVVGGTLRDYLSQKPCSDFDLTGENAAELGTRFSRTHNFTSFSLDKTPGRKTVRVILDQERHLDFTDLQGKNIEEDLSQRDFTINAMGQLLGNFLSGKTNIIDPFKGREDLLNRKIRVLQGPIFQSDPIRMLRAFRFAAILNFAIDEETLSKISLHKSKLHESAPERIWQELILFFKTPDTISLLKIMHDCGLLRCLFPISDTTRTFAQYQQLEALLKDPGKTFPEYTKELSANALLNKQYLLKFAALRTNPSSAVTGDFSLPWDLRASNAETKFVDQALNGARHLAATCFKKTNTADAYELNEKIHQELPASAILFITDVATKDKSAIEDRIVFCNHVFKFYYRQFLPAISKKPLLNGEDIIHQFRLSPSPLFGKILHCVQKAQVLGDIASREEAIALAENIIQSQTTESDE